ncbi:hypothetical protein CVT25_011552 [Psilocybe cyanescens]|uniref:T6SS Phospholipase effector Tle1-like catalytic domain-containing protein n=1 Tax=Psilocybe cyanescens TaxID=93625 RepID=A0A409VVC1_PSICY|nr:hypothetical protein CVT25_011552 [Psilocybe cyanescens]
MRTREGSISKAECLPFLTQEQAPDACCRCHQIDSANRNLIVCIDGTDNQFGDKARFLDKNTNVIELYNLILKGKDFNQRTWYNSGIGTYVRPSWAAVGDFLFHKIDSAIAWNFERTILGAYRWLSDNYEPGDCIFLFGFSRGAFQVRVLSAMIHRVGLIYKGNEMQIPFAYELYKNSDRKTKATGIGSSDTKSTTSADRFKRAFSYEGVKVHFVGAWDTVSSIGLIRRKAMLPGTVDGMQHVCYFRHALALDERRVKFLPEYAYGGSACPRSAPSPGQPSSSEPTGRVQGSQCLDGVKSPPKVLEVWFAGTHSDIGGGNVDNSEMNRSRPPLRWMVFEAGALGLRTALFDRELKPNEQVDIKESLTLLWWPLELLCFRRLTYTRRENGKTTTFKPHLGSSRKIHPGQKIHSSFILADKPVYTPKARPLSDETDFWSKFRNDDKVSANWLERDLYSYADDLVKQYIDKQDLVVLQTLYQITSGFFVAYRQHFEADGRQAVCKSLYERVIRIGNPWTERQILLSTMDILGSSARELKLTHSSKIRSLVLDLLKSEIISRPEARQIVECWTDPRIFVLEGHEGFVCAVAFSPDSKILASGSNDHTVRFWDVDNGKPMKEPMRTGGHSGYVTSVAFSSDGKQVVSGSYDKTLRIWDAMTGSPVGSPLEKHSDSVTSVAFSPDNTKVLSGSDDQTIRIWDLETGQTSLDPFQTLASQVWSVAFSPNGTQVVSGSSDHAVQIWDVSKRTSEAVRRFKGHTGSVRSVAFSLDGKFVVSGSADRTVRVWNVETGRLVGEPFGGHTGWVSSVAFSLDGKRVISGSSDYTARIWHVRSGRQLKVLIGHNGTVTSVAFSPDGRRVASGSSDKTVYIWDVDID